MQKNAPKRFYVLKLGQPDANESLIQIRNARLELLGLAQADDALAIASFFGISKLNKKTSQFIKALYPGQIKVIPL